MVYMYTSNVHYCIHVDSGSGVTMTYVHSYFTVHVRSARMRTARRRARKILILFSAPANQWPRLGAARTVTQRVCSTRHYIYPDVRAPQPTTTHDASRRGESALHGNAVGVSGEAPEGGRMIPMSTGAPGAAPAAVIATHNDERSC